MEKLHRFVNKSVATTGKMLSYDAKTFDLPKHYNFVLSNAVTFRHFHV